IRNCNHIKHGELMRANPDRLVGFLHAFFELPKKNGVVNGQIVERCRVARISLSPHLFCFYFLVGFAGHHPVICASDRQLFPLADQQFVALAVGLESFQRRCSRLLHGLVKLLDRGKRLTELFAKPRSGGANAGRTFSFASAVTCSRASVSPLRQFTASSDITYWLPNAAIVPFSGLDIFALADAQRTRFGQHGNQFIRHAVGEEVLLLVPREVVERQHCHGLDGLPCSPARRTGLTSRATTQRSVVPERCGQQSREQYCAAALPKSDQRRAATVRLESRRHPSDPD